MALKEKIIQRLSEKEPNIHFCSAKKGLLVNGVHYDLILTDGLEAFGFLHNYDIVEELAESIHENMKEVGLV